MIRLLILSLLLILSGYSYGQPQNLVINGSIEADSCKGQSWDPNEVLGWRQHSSADHIHYGCWSLPDTYWIPNNGRAALGMYNDGFSIQANGDSNIVREYVAGSLKSMLELDKSYSVSYWVKPSAYADKVWEFMTSDQASLAFFADNLEMASHDENGDRKDILSFEPDVINPYGILYNYENYIQIEDCYTARGDERYFILGNFEALGESQMDTLWKDRSTIPQAVSRWRNRAYLLIDDVEVYEVPELEISDTLICDADRYVLYLEDFPYREVWVDGERLQDSLVLTKSGKHKMTAITGSCQRSAAFSVEFASCQECSFYIPNIISTSAFSPDDRMLIASDCDMEVSAARVYDRWGAVVYDSKDELEWDGRLSSSDLTIGVYVYVVDVQVREAEGMREEQLVGTVTVVE